VQTKKSLGQHWLFDEKSLNAMLEAGEVTADDVVLEVGPGLGTLTKKLCQKANRVIAVELDEELAENLHTNVARHPEPSEGSEIPHDVQNDKINNLEIMHGSILDVDLESMPENYKVIANIPYYLTSNLVRKLLEAKNQPSQIVLLIQKEVAERIVAGPGQHSVLSISVQFYAEAELKQEVPAELFTPPPKVDSQIIKITPRDKPLFTDVDEKDFFKIVRAGFSEKRKKLRSSLSGGLQISKAEVDEWLQKANISPDARAQELSLSDWYALYKNKY